MFKFAWQNYNIYLDHIYSMCKTFNPSKIYRDPVSAGMTTT